MSEFRYLTEDNLPQHVILWVSQELRHGWFDQLLSESHVVALPAVPVRLEPGCTYAITVDRPLSPSGLEHIRQQLDIAEAKSGCTFILLDAGIQVLQSMPTVAIPNEG